MRHEKKLVLVVPKRMPLFCISMSLEHPPKIVLVLMLLFCISMSFTHK